MHERVREDALELHMWQIQGAREAGRCAEGERGRKLNGNMMNRR